MRLLRRSQFVVLERRGARHSGAHLRCLCLPNRKGYLRLGMTVSRRFGKAVERNRCKRLIREAFRHLAPFSSSSWDCILIPKESAREASLHQIRDDLVYFCAKFTTNASHRGAREMNSSTYE